MMDNMLKVEVPPTFTRDEANARRADMIARGLVVWTFTRRDMTALVRVDGWWGGGDDE